MLPPNHYNVILKNANGLYIGVPSNPFEKIIGLNKLDKSIGEDIDNLTPNQIGILYIDYEYGELTLKRIYTIGSDTEPMVDLLAMPSDKLYNLITNIVQDYTSNNTI